MYEVSPRAVADVLAEYRLEPGRDGYLSVAQVARATGRNPSTIQRWFDAGRLDGYRTQGSARRPGWRRITPESAASLLAGN